MKYDAGEAAQIRELVLAEQKKGNKIVAFLDSEDTVLSKADLSFFDNGYEAAEFCYENSTDHDRIMMTSTAHVLQDIDYQLMQKNELTILNKNDMNQDNLDYLKKQVKFTGFGDSLENELKANIEKQEPTFQLKYPHDFGKDETVSTLNFRRSDNNDMYFFNNYNLSVKPQGKEDSISQTFYVGKENTFTLKEGYNLLSGRSVNKDLVNKEKEAYNAWVKLDFKETDNGGNFKLKHYTENYGYNIQEALSKLPIKELANEGDKEKLLDSLQKGNRQSVTFLDNGSEQKRFIEANPQFKSITVYDGNMKRIRQDQKEQESTGQTTSQDKKQTAKQKNNDGDGSPKQATKRNKKNHQKVS